jgi:hypothetical protein
MFAVSLARVDRRAGVRNGARRKRTFFVGKSPRGKWSDRFRQDHLPDPTADVLVLRWRLPGRDVWFGRHGRSEFFKILHILFSNGKQRSVD